MISDIFSKMYFTLSQRSPLFCGDFFFLLMAVFLLQLFIIFRENLKSPNAQPTELFG